MHSHKVRYVPATYSQKNMLDHIGVFDGVTSSKELEALIVEEFELGFELHSVVNVPVSKMGVVFTAGFIVTLKKVN